MKQNDYVDSLTDQTLITGGHFVLTENSESLNEGTLNSFRLAVSTYSLGKKKYPNLALGILINDIGMVCSASECQIGKVLSRDTFIFPPEYLEILDQHEVKEKEVELFWEKHIRNRAKKQLHSQLSQNNPYIQYRDREGYAYHCPKENIEILLTRYQKNDRRGTPACPLIMSAYSFEHKRLGFKSSLNFYYVGEDNYMNVANHFVIEKGRFLASQFSNGELTIKNVYVFENKTLKNF
ncbi:MAG: hypothetical protein S4CHLAM45_02080 [Chlamydiales bacterium]|nr:hypothetical protein [Chlamydiales bacterium]MCH9620345.1 hypothetical protein [Chlamydiales bacterium]MCH9622331.1 hypothetical protein [Chlamydiales bacterium]